MKKNRKKILIAVLFGFIIFLIAGYFLILSNEEQKESIETTKNLFPFGQITPGNKTNSGNSQGTIGNDAQTNQQGAGDTVDEPEVLGSRLRKISSFPTGGFKSFIRIEEKEITDIEINSEGETVQITKTIDVANQMVRYSEIENANVHESIVDASTIIPEIVVDNFIPNAEYAFFNKSADRVVFQYWNKEARAIESYLAHIKKITFEIDPCPFDFSKVYLGDDSERIIGVHQFLNRNPQTQLASFGVNSPGNEASLVTEATLTGIKNFQSLYQLDIDGSLGPATRGKMLQICNDQQEKIAKAEFNTLDRKYTISGSFLPQNITGISVSPSKDMLFYLQEDTTGVLGVVRDLLKGTRTTIFESPFTEWLVDWNNARSIELTTKPSYAVDGYSYHLDSSNGRYFKSLSERNGLLTLASPNNKKILVMETLDSGIRTSIHTRITNRTKTLNIQTFPEKCVWSIDSLDIYCAVPNALAYGNEYPDVWYQGLETYTDSLWKINAQTLEEEVLSNISIEYDELLDIESIELSPKGEYLYFIDKKTEHLWSYRLADF